MFTILIAVISDAYAAVQDDVESQELDEDDAGGIAVILRCVLGYTGHYTGPLPENDQSVNKSSEEVTHIENTSKAMRNC